MSVHLTVKSPTGQLYVLQDVKKVVKVPRRFARWAIDYNLPMEPVGFMILALVGKREPVVGEARRMEMRGWMVTVKGV